MTMKLLMFYSSIDMRSLPVKQQHSHLTAIHLPVPHLPIGQQNRDNRYHHHSQRNNRHLSSSSMIDTTCQRIKDWIAVTNSATALNHDEHHRSTRVRFVSANNITEQTPMLNVYNDYSSNVSTFAKLERSRAPGEQLYGHISLTNSPNRVQQQLLLVDDHVASVRHYAARQRTSLTSISSSLLKNHRHCIHGPSLSSSGASSSQQGTGKSQNSLQTVTLDTDDTSSCSSSLTHRSTSRQSASNSNHSSRGRSQHRKRPKFKNLAKNSANNERKAMRVLLIIFSIFVLLWTPFFIITLLSCFIADIHPVLISIATWLGYCSSCANPIIYTIFSRAFRRAFINILTCQKVILSHRSPILQPLCRSMTVSTKRKLVSSNHEPA
jgi:hypothetical protein